jgi:hypothetical protein
MSVCKIWITDEICARVALRDRDLVEQHVWRLRRTKVSRILYALTTIERDGKPFTLSMHRMIMGEPEGLVVDHINGDGLDNRYRNLRAVPHAVNCANRHVSTSNTGVLNVSFEWKRTGRHCYPYYRAMLTRDGKIIHQSYHRTLEDATAAAERARQEWWDQLDAE